jgi:hypothetical protein
MQSPSVASVDSGERVALLNLQEVGKARPLVLNGPAAAIWQMLSEPKTPDAVVAMLQHRWGRGTVMQPQVLQFLEMLIQEGLLTPADEVCGV